MRRASSSSILTGSRFFVAFSRVAVPVLCIALLILGQRTTTSNASAFTSDTDTPDAPTLTPTDTDVAVTTEPTIRPTHRPTWTRTPDTFELTAAIRFGTAEARKYNQRFFPTATALAEGAKILVNAQSGTLHDDINDRLAVYDADVNIKNGIVSVRIYNPEKRIGYFGLLFRHTNFNKQYRLFIDFRGSWNYGYGTATYSRGSLSRLDRTPHGFNDLTLVFKDKETIFFLNGDYINRLNISQIQDKGIVSVFAGVYRGDKASHQAIEFDRFMVAELP